METVYILLGFNSKLDSPDPSFLKVPSEKWFVSSMTLGFNMAFSRTFSEVCHFRTKDDSFLNLVIDGQQSSIELKIGQVLFVESAEDYLDGVKGADYIFIIEVKTENKDAFLAILQEEKTEFNKTKFILDCLNNSDLAEVNSLYTHISNYRSDYPSFKVWKDENIKSNYSTSFMACFAYYFYGWLILTRLEREINSLSLYEKNILNKDWSDELVNNRKILINASRYFLTTNRSTNVRMKEYCNYISSLSEVEEGRKSFFGIQKRYKRLEKLQKEIEQYVEMVTAIEDSKRSKSINTTVKVLTSLGIPMALLGTMFEFNLSNELLDTPFQTIYSKKFQTIVFVSIALPLTIWSIVFGALKVFNKLKSRND